MTSQAISQPGNFLFGLLQVAIEAPTHIHFRCLPGYIHLADITVASLAIQTSAKVWLVAEKYKIRLAINLDPRDGGFIFVVVGNLLYKRAVYFNYLVAAHAFLDGWDAGYGGAQSTRMAV